MEQNQQLTVVYAADRNLYDKFPTVLNSLFTNNPTAKVYLFIEDDSIDYITHPNVTFKNLNMFKDYILPSSPQKDYYLPWITFIRLWMCEVIPESRVLWLDVDTIVDKDLTDLWNTDLEDNIVAGVLDQGYTCYPQITRFYINAGVLLMDLDKWRALKYNNRSRYLVNVKAWQFGDQDIINLLCRDKVLYLNCRYNYGRFICRDGLTRPIKIYHWPGHPKAWESVDEFDKWLWMKYYTEKI